jgi:hypothetical protein
MLACPNNGRIVMRIFIFLLVFFGLSLAACSAPDSRTADTGAANTNPWTLTNAESRFEFISVKKGTIVETHSFGELSGTVESDGKARVKIMLDSVETNIDIRNERMRKYLFETDKTPTATFMVNIDMAMFASMAIGERKDISKTILIYMHDKAISLEVDLTVTRLGANKVAVESQTPVIFDTDRLGFGDGILKLQELAKLNIIAPEVPVMFSLVFER